MGVYKDYPGNIYKNDGVYNDDGIYKDGAGGGGGGDIIFLTYFDNFDESTGMDTPIVGDPYILDLSKQKLTRSSLNLFGGDCPALRDAGLTSQAVGFSLPIPGDVEYISAELFVLCKGGGSTIGSVLGVGVSNIILDPYYSSSEFGIFGPDYPSVSPDDYTMFNGTVREATNYFKFGKNIRYKTSHVASTYDVKNQIVRYYVDGDIMLEIRNFQRTTYAFKIQQNDSSKSFTLSGVAYFSNDKSINGGMNYPIPTERYA